MKKLICCLPFLLIGCGGGDGGSIIGDVGFATGDEPTLLPTYDYQFGATPAGEPLTVIVPGRGGVRIIRIDLGNSLNGDVNIVIDTDGDAAITDYTLQSPSTMSVDSDGGTAFLGAFDILVIEDMSFVAGEPPDSGGFQVVTTDETVTLQAGTDVVAISLDGGEPIVFTWDQLDDLIDEEQAPEWWRRAALAGEVLEFVLVQAFSVTEALNFIDDELATVNPLVTSCDAFTGSPPAGVLAQGEMTFTWVGSGTAPADGDDFEWAFTDCWFDDEDSTVDRLVNGGVGLNGYVEEVDSQLRVTGTGFDEVIFSNVRIAETEESLPGFFTIDPLSRITVNGGLGLSYTEPVTQ